MEKIDFGYTYDDTGLEQPAPEPEDEKKVHYPSLYVSDMKDDDDIEVGDEFLALVKMKKKSADYHECEKGKRYNCTYEVKWMQVKSPPKAKSVAEGLDMLMED